MFIYDSGNNPVIPFDSKETELILFNEAVLRDTAASIVPLMTTGYIFTAAKDSSWINTAD